MNSSNTEHSSSEKHSIEKSEMMPVKQDTTLAENQASSQANNSEDMDRHRSIQTFMKRRTHMNKQAEMALTDPNFAKYLVNIHVQDGSDESKKVIDSPIEDLADNEKKHRFAKIENIPDDVSGITDLRALFSDSPNGVEAPLTLEIGFGMGDSLIEMAIAEPNRNFIGIEVHEPGIGRCAYMAFENGLENLKIINGDAIKLMKQLPENHIDRVQLYFPDPWQKKRHYKRRFVSPERIEIVTRVLNQGGWFHCATDWEHYSQWMLDVLDNFEGLSNFSGKSNFTPRPDFRPMTKFEKRGIDRGHGIWDLIYSKDE